MPNAASAAIACGKLVDRKTCMRKLSSGLADPLRGQDRPRNLSISPAGCRRRRSMEYV